MVKVRLTGKIPFSEIAKGSKPEHIFLPKPSRLRSDMDDVDLRSITEEEREFGWEAVWYGDELCRRVLKRSNKHLEYYIGIDRIYRKLGKVGGTAKANEDGLRMLIKENSRSVSRWEEIVNTISTQLKASILP